MILTLHVHVHIETLGNLNVKVMVLLAIASVKEVIFCMQDDKKHDGIPV